MAEKTIQTNQTIMIAERRIINAIFHDQTILDKIDHTKMIHGNVVSLVKAMEKMKEKGIKPTTQSLLQFASDIDLNIEEDLIKAVTTEEPEQNVDDAIEVLRESKKRLDVIRSLRKTIDLIDSASIHDEENIKKAREAIDESLISLSGTDDDISRVYTMTEWLDDYEMNRELRKNGPQFPFNCFVFDELIPDGAAPGTIGILAAASGSGKSTIALKFVRCLVNTDVPCMYFSLEMSNTATADRFISAETQIPYIELLKSATPPDFEAITKEIKLKREELDLKKKFRICEDASLSLRDIESHIIKFQSDIGQKYCVIVIDLLSMVHDFETAGGGMNYADSITIAMNKLSAMTKRLGVHVLGVVQLNRSSENERASEWDDLKKFRPLRSHIKSAGAYVERARYVLGAFRPMHWAKTLNLDPSQYAAQTDICEISVLKINNGETGKIVEAIFDHDVFDLKVITNGISSSPDLLDNGDESI